MPHWRSEAIDTKTIIQLTTGCLYTGSNHNLINDNKGIIGSHWWIELGVTGACHNIWYYACHKWASLFSLSNKTKKECSMYIGLDTPKTVAFFYVGKGWNLKEKHGGSCRFHSASSVNGKTSNTSMTKTTPRFFLVCQVHVMVHPLIPISHHEKNISNVL